MKKYLMANCHQTYQQTGSFRTVARLIKCLMILAIILTSALIVACSAEKPINKPSETYLKTEVMSVSIGPGLFRSDEFYLEVQLPPGWAAVEGPEFLMQHLEGQVAFNSWGQKDFWAREVRKVLPDGSIEYSQYGPADVASQIPDGEAYVALVRTFSPPPPPPDYNTPPEYMLDGLSGLYQPHDWRQDSTSYAYFKTFYMRDSWFELVISCNQNASDETVNELNDLLQSWRFTR
jgi:hypothetical protein